VALLFAQQSKRQHLLLQYETILFENAIAPRRLIHRLCNYVTFSRICGFIATRNCCDAHIAQFNKIAKTFRRPEINKPIDSLTIIRRSTWLRSCGQYLFGSQPGADGKHMRVLFHFGAGFAIENVG
jgi:hypothetical protein